MLKQPLPRDKLPGRAFMELECPALIRELSHLDEDTKDIPGAQGAQIPQSDILLSQGEGESWSHKKAHFNCPHPRAERDPETPHTPPLIHPLCNPLWSPLTGPLHTPPEMGDHHLPRLTITSSDGSACCEFSPLLKGSEPPHDFHELALPLTCGELTFCGLRRQC